jgi:hypothetical protein
VKAQRGSTLSLTSTLYVGEWSTPRSGRLTTVPILREAGWAPGPVWTGGENVASVGIRSPESPARIELLYTLHYPVPHIWKIYFAVLQTWRDKAGLVYARHYSEWAKIFNPVFEPQERQSIFFSAPRSDSPRKPLGLLSGSYQGLSPVVRRSCYWTTWFCSWQQQLLLS